MEGFLELLAFYLKSSIIGWEKGVYVQKSGVCIGSKVAPVLSNIFLAKVDRAIEANMNGLVRKVYRYVDDYIILVDRSNFTNNAINILKIFREKALGLEFTFEMPLQGALQFLDLNLSFHDKQVCWQYQPRSSKPLLSFASAHSKIIKNGIAFSTLKSALTKSCDH